MFTKRAAISLILLFVIDGFQNVRPIVYGHFPVRLWRVVTELGDYVILLS